MPANARRRGLNENYAREIMELHTLGVDGGYTQQDVREVARCFTGWTLLRPRGEAEFHFEPRLHDQGAKTVLGTRIPAGGGMDDGMKVIDLLARHPATAKFIATKLARRFVADDPPRGFGQRAAEAFRRSDGDIRTVLRTIIESPEFSSPEVYQAKVKKPLGVRRQRLARHRRGDASHSATVALSRPHGRAAVLGPAADRLPGCRRFLDQPGYVADAHEFRRRSGQPIASTARACSRARSATLKRSYA